MDSIHSSAPQKTKAVLQVQDLQVYYGESHALQGVSLTLERGVLSVVGRNGMGKTTLCNAIVGLMPVRSGSIRFEGRELVGIEPHQIARAGVGFVPQGRRLWPSLSVDETLRLSTRVKGAWTIERVYSTFPRLAERRGNGGGQLSGGEQQMLAIARALLGNPRLLVMDEPTEGLAPMIVGQVRDLLIRLAHEEDIAILVVEQNIGVATSVSDHVAIMVNGRVNRIMDASTLAADRDLQQRLLGVGRHGHDETDAAPAAVTAVCGGADWNPGFPRGPRRRNGRRRRGPCLPRRSSSEPLGSASGKSGEPARGPRVGRSQRRLGSCLYPLRSASDARRSSSARSTPKATNSATSVTGSARTACRLARSISRPRASRPAPT